MKKFLDFIVSLALNLIWFSFWLYSLVISTNIPVRISETQFTTTIGLMVGFLLVMSIYLLKFSKMPKLSCTFFIVEMLLWFISFKDDSLVIIQTPSDVMNSNIAATGLLVTTILLFFAYRRVVVLKKLKRKNKLKTISDRRKEITSSDDENKKAS
ncbi:hypothetical protein [Clostridium chrysemydis]|uniref:hypothetical protein n=1 Tax=Clostridium chrysemydis TaxID=2665504 RepID=UPI001883E1CC|nr:hypothetical protein [Clostridium chrysemydis]